MFDYFNNKFNASPHLTSNPVNHYQSDMNNYVTSVYFTDAPYLNIPETHEAFKKSHKSKFWNSRRRFLKKLMKDYDRVKIVIYEEPNDIKAYLPAVQKLFSKRWENEYTSFAWKSEIGFKPYSDAMIELSKTKEGLLCMIIVNDDVKIFGYVLINNKKMFLYQLAATPDLEFRKYDLAGILMQKLIEFGIDRNKNELDFGLGIIGYKMKWAKNQRKIYFNVVTPKSFLNRIVHTFKVLSYKIKFSIQRNRKLVSLIKRVFK